MTQNSEDKDPIITVKNELYKAFGMLLQLMAKTPGWAEKNAKDIYERHLPALVTQQFRFVVDDDNEATAYISWALINKAVEEKVADKNPLALSDWQSGETGLVADVICADAQTATRLINLLKQEVFADKTLKALRVSPAGAVLTDVPPATIQKQ